MVIANFSSDYIFYEKLNDGVVEIFISVAKYAIGAYFITCMLLIPFNYYLMESSESSVSEELILPITSVVNRTTGWDFLAYNYEGEEKLFYGSMKSYTKLEKNKNINDYKVIFTVKKGAFNTLVITKWKIEKH